MVDEGRGTFAVQSVTATSSARSGRPVTVSVEVERGLPVDPVIFTSQVAAILFDERGWQGVKGVRFVPLDAAQIKAGRAVDIRVTLASPTTTARLCYPLNTAIQQVSCWNRGRSVINLYRWVEGASTYDNLDRYRTYLINHEVGHGLGLGHVGCPAPRAKAPIMVQQTKSLQGCRPWPYPAR